ncbi:MAG: hypothetical protein ACI9UK_001171 [Candidatus Krumholzibacteriia bacterium]|jgi:hypothetical protein
MEFREAEACFYHRCYRASVRLFCSVLDKALRANGYKAKILSKLYFQIEAAAEDGIITQARKNKAHQDVRVWGNDVLHDEWTEVKAEALVLARHYCQRVLEDFYNDREAVLSQLVESGRLPGPN